ncbi:MAG: hypothetical protein IJ251_06400 [Oscillospiraceae bacterium]|nr:hypothetical protein [Oscillospiraceae bacterium]
MNIDFHYYATYCAAFIAGYSHEKSLDICYSAQMTDCLTASYLAKINAPRLAATTQSQIELANARTDVMGLQNITRIWASFHFLPYDLYAVTDKRRSRLYMSKYRLICGPDGDLSVDTVKLAKGKSLQHIGLSMHIIADTWAHRYFAGTPSLVINNTNSYFYEMPDERQIEFRHSASAPDDPEKGIYSNSIYLPEENSIMNLGHGRAGHLPDYSFMRYKYLPAWGDYNEVVKDNPSDYYKAFCQMIYAFRFFRGGYDDYEKGSFDYAAAEPYRDAVTKILLRRQLDSSRDWKELGESLSGKKIPVFDTDRYCEEYTDAPKNGKDDTYLGKFIKAAIEQKSMVTNRIFRSGSLLAGISLEITDPAKQIRELIRQAGEQE